MKNCPCCDVEMSSATVGQVEVEVCPQCGGVWFDHHELTELVQAGLHHLSAADDIAHGQPPQPLPHPHRCPNCGTDLFLFEFKHTPGIRWRGCRTCKGIWAEDGQLTALQQQLAPARPPEPVPAAVPVSPAVPVAAAEPSPPPAKEVPADKWACPQCGELNPLESTVCWACGEPIPPEAKPNLCPACQVPLKTTGRAGMAVDACSQCGRLWFTEEVLGEILVRQHDKLAEIHAASPPPPASLPPLPEEATCPYCGTRLWQQEIIIPVRELYNYQSGMEVPMCPACNRTCFTPEQLRELYDGLGEYVRSLSEC